MSTFIRLCTPSTKSHVTSEGRNDSIGEYVACLDYLHTSIDQTREFYQVLKITESTEENEGLFTSALESWLLLEKYINACDASGAYYAAAILDPEVKWGWFDEHWGQHSEKAAWIAPTRALVQELWNEEYSKLPQSTTSPRSYRRAAVDLSHPFAALQSHKRVRLSSPEPAINGYQQWCNTPRESGDPLRYWNHIYETGKAPAMAQFALDMLAIPAMSDECERVFSSAKLLISDRRNRLKIDAIEANECLRNWYGKPDKDAFDIDPEVETMDGGDVGTGVWP